MNAIHPTRPQSGRQRHVASYSIKNGTRGGRKVQSLRVTPGKIIRAQAMLVEGCSQREISRALEMSPHTVAKLIKTEDFQNFIRSQREQLFGIASLALDSLLAGVTTDPHLAYVVLKDLGIVPDRNTMLNLAHIEPPPQSKDERDARQTNLIAAVIQQRYKVFNIELPDDMKGALAKENAASEQKTEQETQPDPHSNNDTDAFDLGAGRIKSAARSTFVRMLATTAPGREAAAHIRTQSKTSI
jgi:hypothetical protein